MIQTIDSARLARALSSLGSLSVGDAFGERFFVAPDHVAGLIAARAMPAPPWNYTDDTAMALSIVENLRRHGGIEQGDLARDFAERYDPSRGYGPAMHQLLRRIGEGEDWREVSQREFDPVGELEHAASYEKG